MEYPWQETLWMRTRQALEAGRLHHGLLLEGPAGLGKRDFALRLASILLDAENHDPETGAPVHPDYHHVTVPEDRKQITIAQVQALSETLSLTSYAGGARVAVLEPAERMNRHAANSLLKTLEEPPPGAYLLLVRSRLDTLPATIASRCQRLRFAVPDEATALAWLEARDATKAWPRLLSLAEGAPLRALDLAAAEADRLDDTFREALADIAAGRQDPVAVAAAWQEPGLDLCLRWLNRWTCDLIRLKACGHLPPGLSDPSHSLAKLVDTISDARLHAYLDRVQMSRRRLDGSLNAELLMESLLIPWANGLDVGDTGYQEQ